MSEPKETPTREKMVEWLDERIEYYQVKMETDFSTMLQAIREALIERPRASRKEVIDLGYKMLMSPSPHEELFKWLTELGVEVEG